MTMEDTQLSAANKQTAGVDTYQDEIESANEDATYGQIKWVKKQFKVLTH